MGDESQRDYDQYIATLPKAPIIWLKGCRECGATGMIHSECETYLCICVKKFVCPQCGHNHGRPFFAAQRDVLRRCYRCHWSIANV